MDSKVSSGFFSVERPLYHVGYNEFIVNLYDEAIRAAIRQEPHFQQLLAGIVNHLLGIELTVGPGTAGCRRKSLWCLSIWPRRH